MDCLYLECSALAGEGIKTLFEKSIEKHIIYISEKKKKQPYGCYII